MVGLESMQGMQREFQTICLTKLSNTCRQTQVQAGGERSEPPCLYNTKVAGLGEILSSEIFGYTFVWLSRHWDGYRRVIPNVREAIPVPAKAHLHNMYTCMNHIEGINAVSCVYCLHPYRPMMPTYPWLLATPRGPLE